MKKHTLLLAACAVLLVAGLVQAQTAKDNLIQFYQNYLSLVSAGNYVTLSRDEPDAWQTAFDGIAKNAGFEDAAAALAAGEAMSADSDIASLRQAVADRIVQQYQPYRE